MKHKLHLKDKVSEIIIIILLLNNSNYDSTQLTWIFVGENNNNNDQRRRRRKESRVNQILYGDSPSLHTLTSSTKVLIGMLSSLYHHYSLVVLSSLSSS